MNPLIKVDEAMIGVLKRARDETGPSVVELVV